MDQQASTTSNIPENAYKELKPGEEYRPIMVPEQSYLRLLCGQ